MVTDFKKAIKTDEATLNRIAELKEAVNEWATTFPMPGYEDH